MDSKEEQLVLGELRAMRTDFSELSLMLRSESVGQQVASNIAYIRQATAAIPRFVKVMFIAGVAMLTSTLLITDHKLKTELAVFAINLLLTAIVMMGGM